MVKTHAITGNWKVIWYGCNVRLMWPTSSCKFILLWVQVCGVESPCWGRFRLHTPWLYIELHRQFRCNLFDFCWIKFTTTILLVYIILHYIMHLLLEDFRFFLKTEVILYTISRLCVTRLILGPESGSQSHNTSLVLWLLSCLLWQIKIIAVTYSDCFTAEILYMGDVWTLYNRCDRHDWLTRLKSGCQVDNAVLPCFGGPVTRHCQPVDGSRDQCAGRGRRRQL